MCRAFEMAGARVQLVHLDALIRTPSLLDKADLVGFPGGFSFGDDIASGRIFAMKLRERLYPALRDAVSRGAPMIGACNGFQVLVQVGLLPGPGVGEAWPVDIAPRQTTALTDNRDARFCDRWVGVVPQRESVCIWTRGLADLMPDDPAARRDIMQLPVAHGEGRFVADDATLAAMRRAGQVALTYADNYNGSAGAVAGICDASGRIFGLMPHPERYLDWTRHPYWTRLAAGVRGQETPGLMMFRNAVEAASLVEAP
jgi:phosphoribosylformylglycinamidine synthase